MKAIKYLSVLFFLSVIFIACKTKDQPKQSLDPTTKAYFGIKDGSTYTFTDVKDTNLNIIYTSSGFVNNQTNPDVSNNEIMSYNLNATGQKPLTIRCETGDEQAKDLIAMITNYNNINTAGPIIFNTFGEFSTIYNSSDSIYQYPSYIINGKTYTSVLKIVMKQNSFYKEVYYAKNIGLMAFKDLNGLFLYAKKYNVIQ